MSQIMRDHAPRVEREEQADQLADCVSGWLASLIVALVAAGVLTLFVRWLI